ncbi:hypothetical protein RFI_08488 [Reticulomyxa filosa]|uniref:Uncharacterized protein n=1 Tax=Reticulomyxa filosa TaxID=46433 RepID=X6NQR7_RETFI|nr:hypothetical protein RFI_08488 [Reticulomyxa filosa]|eukprot:ETO28640.1 hypothetical protein RFI_08488 [Reticulomyxa filosa]
MKTIFVILLGIAELVILCYAFYQCLYLKKVQNRWLCFSLLSYHLILVIDLDMEIRRYVSMMAGYQSSNVSMKVLECRIEIMYRLWLPFSYYHLLLLFLYIRLEVVFRESILEISKQFQWIFLVGFVVSFIAATIAFFLLASGQSANFCVLPTEVWDFFFFLIQRTVPHISIQCNFENLDAEIIALSAAGVYIVILMLALSYQYVIRLHYLAKHDSEDIWGNNQRLTYSLRKACWIAVAAISSSLLAFAVSLSSYGIGTLLSYWDGFFNGILLLASLDFGDWIYRHMCKRCIFRPLGTQSTSSCSRQVSMVNDYRFEIIYDWHPCQKIPWQGEKVVDFVFVLVTFFNVDRFGCCIPSLSFVLAKFLLFFNSNVILFLFVSTKLSGSLGKLCSSALKKNRNDNMLL